MIYESPLLGQKDRVIHEWERVKQQANKAAHDVFLFDEPWLTCMSLATQTKFRQNVH